MLSPQSFPAAQPRPLTRAESPMRRLRRLAFAALCGGLLAAGVVVLEPDARAAELSAVTHSSGGSESVRAASLLAHDVEGTGYFSPALIADLGYAPSLEGNSATRADGDCSSPVPLPASFEPACRTHDLGYDLLRVADRRGERLPERLRRDLDARLSRDMHASCPPRDRSDGLRERLDRAGCHAMASIAYKAVQANTLRQANGAPVEESWPW